LAALYSLAYFPNTATSRALPEPFSRTVRFEPSEIWTKNYFFNTLLLIDGENPRFASIGRVQEFDKKSHPPQTKTLSFIPSPRIRQRRAQCSGSPENGETRTIDPGRNRQLPKTDHSVIAVKLGIKGKGYFISR